MRLRQAVTVIATLAVVEVFLTTILWSANHETLRYVLEQHDLIGVVIAVEFATVGAIVLHRWIDHALGWLFLLVGQLMAINALAGEFVIRWPASPLATAAAMLAEFLWIPTGLAAVGLFPLLFPDGRPASRRWHWLIWLAAAASLASAVVLAFVRMPDYPQYRNPFAASKPVQAALMYVLLGVAVVAFGCGLAGFGNLIRRMVRTTGSERRRIAWFFAGLLLVVIVQPLPVNVIVPTIANALLPVFLGIGMLRHGLFDGDRLLNRTLVYGVLTVLIAGVFGVTVGLAGQALGGSGTGAIAAAVVIALGLAPARDVVQRIVDRVLYGARRDPYAALTGLGRQLSEVIAPEDVLPVVARTVCGSLRLPYAAVTLTGTVTPAAAEGERPETTVDLELWHAGAPVGVLTVGLPPGQRFLDPTDERLLAHFAQQAGAAAHSVGLTDALRRSRDALAVARDEERYRIRRDLHDGLGPTLAGIALGLGAAIRSAGTVDDADLLGHLHAEVQGSLDDVKRLVADLRPTVLEQVGLVEALRKYAETVTIRSEGTLKVRLTTPDLVPPLRPEIEVAAYRIVLEAVTNVARHSAATHCSISLAVRDDALMISVGDNGVGLAARTAGGRVGLGLRSMSERAAELGGSCTITSASGTLVEATIPAMIP